jgi:hypothetical protein
MAANPNLKSNPPFKQNNDPVIKDICAGVKDDKGNIIREGLCVHDAHGNHLPGLARRREEEVALYFTPDA